MMKQINKNGKNHFFKRKHKKKSSKQLELQYQLKEFLKLQNGAYPEQPILSIREYQKKKKVQKNPRQLRRRVVK